MFERNERSLGVKNGSIGRIESVSSVRMAVMLDDGRAVAFDLKDYAAVDHGYAATIHKLQGVTVDHAHMLATPGLDRHAAYVALSRHGDGVHLHYGQDDFADESKLVRTLSRERTKDMASDYTRDFADQRQILLPERMIEKGPSEPTRNPITGLDLRPAAPPRARGMFDRLSLPSGGTTRMSEPFVTPEPVSAALPDAVARHARIVHNMRLSHSIGDQYSTAQRTELAASRAALDIIQPIGARDLKRSSTIHG